MNLGRISVAGLFSCLRSPVMLAAWSYVRVEPEPASEAAEYKIHRKVRNKMHADARVEVEVALNVPYTTGRELMADEEDKERQVV